MRRTLVPWVLALAFPAAAAGHAAVAPPFVEAATQTELVFTLANERTAHATIRVRAEAPPGFTIVSAGAPAGWAAMVAGSTISWTGGRLEQSAVASFPVRLLPRSRAGPSTFTFAQAYDDGASVDWSVNVNVLPATGSAAPKQHPWGALAAALAGVAVLAGSLLGLRALRRRSLQDP